MEEKVFAAGPEEVKFDLHDGRTIAGLSWGPKDGAPWLLLHGWLDNANSFQLLAPRIIQHYETEENSPPHLVCIDLAGHGRSSHRPDHSYHFVDHVVDSFEVAVSILKWEKFSIIGHSLGGCVGVFLAAAAPDRVTELVLLEALGPSGDSSRAAIPTLANYLSNFKPFTKKTPSFYTLDAAAHRRKDGNAVGAITLAAARTLVKRATTPHPSETDKISWSFDHAVKDTSRIRFSESAVRNALHRITCPVLLVLARDGMFARGGAEPKTFITPLGRFIMHSLYTTLRIITWLPFIGTPLIPFKEKVKIGVNFCRRVAALQNFTYFETESGGHHMHLTSAKCADQIAWRIKKWYDNDCGRGMKKEFSLWHEASNGVVVLFLVLFLWWKKKQSKR